jgi:predicted RNA-binding Zn-ribbon protein involved in translation (DUF1610 family)
LKPGRNYTFGHLLRLVVFVQALVLESVRIHKRFADRITYPRRCYARGEQSVSYIRCPNCGEQGFEMPAGIYDLGESITCSKCGRVILIAELAPEEKTPTSALGEKGPEDVSSRKP